MPDRLPPLRPDLAQVEAYGAPQLPAPVRLNTNECPHPLPERFGRELADAVAALPFHRYPDRDATALREALAVHADHPAAGLWMANGSNEVILHLCLAYGGAGRRALVFEPTYGLHTLIPRTIGMEVVAEPLDRRFGLPAEAGDAVRRQRPAIVFACSPNNPTGNAHQLEAIDALCDAAGAALVVVDEAYGEFGGSTARDLLPSHRNLAVVRTFSKAFALAAVRLGYCLGAPELVAELTRVRLPYHLSALTQAAGRVALRFRSEALGILDAIRRQRDRSVAGLAAIEGVEVFRSDANFVLFRTPAEGEALWKRLLDRGVLVRDVSTAPGLERCLRVTAGTEEETSAFLAAVPGALEEAS
jgi:histidinol-phosphate aminotransferase